MTWKKEHRLIEAGLDSLARYIWSGHSSQDWEHVIYDISSFLAAFCDHPNQSEYEGAVREELMARIKKIDSASYRKK